MKTLSNIRDWCLTSFEQVLKTLELEGVSMKVVGPINKGLIPVVYNGIRFDLMVPVVEFIGPDKDHSQFHTYAQIVHTGTNRVSLLHGGSIHTRRIFRIILRNTGIQEIQRDSVVSEALECIDRGVWYVASFWNIYEEALMEAHQKLVSMNSSIIRTDFAQFLFNRTITNRLAKIEVVKSPAHVSSHCRTWELGYPGKDMSQGVIRSDLSQDVVFKLAQVFQEKALEVGCDLTVTSKGHPGRRVVFAPEGFSKSLGQVWLWPNFICQTRAPREMFSAIPNAELYETEKGLTPRVTSTLGNPEYLGNRIKYVNATFLSFDEVVVKDEGKYLNADQVLGSGWPLIDGMFNTISERISKEPFVEGESQEEVLERMRKIYGEEVSVTPSVKNNGVFFEISWDVTHIVRENCKMSWKAMNPYACKGMVIPENKLFVEKRDNEDFVRPIYLVFPSEAVEKKGAQAAILRMLNSRLSKPQTVDHTAARGEFKSEITRVMSSLASEGDSSTSQIFVIDPKGNGSISVDGFTQGEGIEACDGIGTLHGTLVPITDAEGNPVRTVVGEMGIMRMPEDNCFGQTIRTKEASNGIRLDSFLVLGNNQDEEFLTDPSVQQKLNFSVQLAHALRHII